MSNLIRHAVPLELKILQNKVDYGAFEKAKNELNIWFSEKLSHIRKPIKNIKFICAEYDVNKIGIGMCVELEE